MLLMMFADVPASGTVKLWLRFSLIDVSEMAALVAVMPELRLTLLLATIAWLVIVMDPKVVPLVKLLKLVFWNELPKIKSSPADGNTFPLQLH
jgi:hypothetical protein